MGIVISATIFFVRPQTDFVTPRNWASHLHFHTSLPRTALAEKPKTPTEPESPPNPDIEELDAMLGIDVDDDAEEVSNFDSVSSLTMKMGPYAVFVKLKNDAAYNKILEQKD